jgi:hypothetical protein
MKKYYYLRGEQKMGPYTAEELKEQNIDRQTWVWFDGLEKWTRLQDVHELRDLAAQIPPPIKPGYDRNDSPGQPPLSPPPIAGNAPPKSWLIESILVTLFLCLPFGIAGIVNASKVESRFYAGDVNGSNRASAEAKRWTSLGFWLGLAAIIIAIIVVIVEESNARKSYYY